MIPSESLRRPLPPGYFADTFYRRLIGRKFSDKDVQSDIKHFPFRVTNQNDKPSINVEVQGKDRSFSPEEISAMGSYFPNPLYLCSNQLGAPAPPLLLSFSLKRWC